MPIQLIRGIILFTLYISAMVHFMGWDYPFLYIGYSCVYAILFTLAFLEWKRGSVLLYVIVYGLLSLLIGLFIRTFPFSPMVKLMMNGKEFILLFVFSLFTIILMEILVMRDKYFIIPMIRVVLIGLLSAFFIGKYGFSPKYELPTPTGPYVVGTQTFELDLPYQHQDILNTSKDSIHYLYQLFYPSEDSEGKNSIPFKNLQTVSTNSFEGISILEEGSFPLIMYSPGAGGSRFDNLSQIEELVSHGYMVAAIEHPYLTDIRYANGRFLKAYNYPKSAHPNHNMADLAHDLRVAQIQEVTKIILERAETDTASIFTQIDPQKTGIFGWSIGGSAAVDLCSNTNLFQAGVNLDGWGFMDIYPGKTRLKAPFLYLRSDIKPAKKLDLIGTGKDMEEVKRMDERQVERELQLIENSRVDVLAYVIKGAFHSNLRDHGLLRVSRLGPIYPERCNEIVTQSVRHFFDQHVKGEREEEFLDWAIGEEELKAVEASKE